MTLRRLNIGTRLGFSFGLILLLVAAAATETVARLAKVQTTLDANRITMDARIGTLNDMRQAMMDAQKKVATLPQASAADPAMQGNLRSVQALQRQTLEAMDELAASLKKDTALANEQAASALTAASLVTLSLTSLVVLFGCAMGWAVTRSITQPLGRAVDLACRVAEGDLTPTSKEEAPDQTGKLLQALTVLNERLARTTGELGRGAEDIAMASDQIAADNLNLSTRILNHASSLEETAAAVDQLTSTVKQNTEHAQQASHMAASASTVAISGGEVVAEMVDTMGSIKDSSRKIIDIISVIDGIAFQTNILALNAAVEAARAGEQGRGFAVVASEVRNLALRSATAAKEIKTLINDTVDKVDAGSELVQQAGRTMDEVVASIQRVTGIMGEIASASSEQGDGIEMVNQVIAQMDEATQQNATLIEQVATAATALQHQAHTLTKVAATFLVDGVRPEQGRFGGMACEQISGTVRKAPAALPQVHRRNAVLAIRNQGR